VSGEVTEVNEALNAAPETINTAANETWLFKLKLKSEDELNSAATLLDAAAYEAFVKEETGH
jgi:glycine cleavage system H protein